MPIHRGNDLYGLYFQWGNHGKKYYYNPESIKSINNAHKKAIRQMEAIYSNGYRGK